jgi:lipoprotein NlpD
MILHSLYRRLAVLSLLAASLLAGCASGPRGLAPVEDHGRSSVANPPAPIGAKAEPEKVLPGAENAGKPGYYTVRQGDTLTRIGLDNGQAWRDLAKWNNLDNPNLIETGQVIRVAPPNAAVETSGVVVRPVSNSGAAAKTPSAEAKDKNSSVNAAVAPAQPVASADEGLAFIWPAAGPLLGGFDEAKNKGLDIGGKAGDAVMAAADGQVVYAGAGLRGYGNLLILKHNNTFLTAYAHNQTLLVKEDQKVKKGQKIAEMGNSDSTSGVKLHFEIRRQGKPVDPAKLLPVR